MVSTVTSLSIAIAQLNYTVGDMYGNKQKILAAYNYASEKGADLVVTSELAIIGYPPEDLLLRPSFQERVFAATEALAADIGETALLLGGICREGDKLYNAGFLLQHGQIQDVTKKHDLPNYGVFDEKRLFDSAPYPDPIPFKGVKLGVMICRDMWNVDIAKALGDKHADILIGMNASPYEQNKQLIRLNVAGEDARASGLPLIYVNQAGGQDEVVFDGRSFVVDSKGELNVELPKWKEGVELTQWAKHEGGWQCETVQESQPMDELESIYQAMMMGLKDYVGKNGFASVIIGLSGGIDSALTAAVAVDALGKEQVQCVMLPSEFTSNESLEDAVECARRLGCNLQDIPIQDAVSLFNGLVPCGLTGLSAENIQSRIRGIILMAMSNETGGMLLSTGNKSELAVGYATLYGDMCGGYNVLKDIYKTDVFKIAKWRNAHLPQDGFGPKEPIPDAIIIKAPTAELRPDQTDQDSLPPYEILDAILRCLIEERMSVNNTIAQGYDEKTVRKVISMLYRAEYKRRQSCPGVKISNMSFGKDRRYPITNGYLNGG